MSKILTTYILLLICMSINAQEQFSIYFDSNKHTLTKTEMVALTTWIAQNKTSKVIGVHGFCDEDGAITYNDTLATKRVEHVFQIIKNKVTIRPDFKSRSFGKLHKQDAIKAKNRKVTLFYLLEKDLDKEEQILGIKPMEIQKSKTPIYFPNTITLTNPNGSESQITLDTQFMETLSNAKTGEKLKINNLNFVLNSFAIMPNSRSKLYELLLVMQKNPTLQINIQGHLCCMTNDTKDLSTQRARAIYKFLEINGIEKSRMSYKGFGVTTPLFPIPENNETERIANRRVEIEIISNQ